MNGKQLADALLVELDKRKRSRIHRSFDEDSLADLLRSALDPQPEQPNYIPLAALPVIPPEFPRLRVRYGGSGMTEQEWIVVNSPAEDAPYGTWFILKVAELDRLKAANVPERPAEQWQQRKQHAEKGKH